MSAEVKWLLGVALFVIAIIVLSSCAPHLLLSCSGTGTCSR